MVKNDTIKNKMVIYIDTREKKYLHIEDYFQKNLINYKFKKLDYGDYSCEVDGIPLESVVFIERKGSIDELCNNFCNGRDWFEKEFGESIGVKYLLIEDGSYEDIRNHNYKSEMNPNALIGSIKSFEVNYGIKTNFISKDFSGDFIYSTLRAFAKKTIEVKKKKEKNNNYDYN